MSDFDRNNVGYIMRDEKGEASWFTARLMRLIVHADNRNLTLLASVYPEEVDAVLTWRESGGGAARGDETPVQRLVRVASDVVRTAAVDPDLGRELDAALEPWA